MNVYRVEVSSKTQITGYLELYWTVALDADAASKKVQKQSKKDFSYEHPIVTKIERMSGVFAA